MTNGSNPNGGAGPHALSASDAQLLSPFGHRNAGRGRSTLTPAAVRRDMGLTLAMTGKGGVGKTTLAALTIEWLVARGEAPILAVDADSNANLHEALGVSFAATVGGIRESARREVPGLKGMAKQEFLDLRVHEALVEQSGYDLVVMGRPEGQGCYCFANNVLRDVLDRLSRQYRHIV